MAHEPICLLDIRGLLLRRFHGSGKTWQDGFQSFLERDLDEVLEIFPPRRIVACWDSGNDVRTEMYSGYKSARKARQQDPEEKAEFSNLVKAAKQFLAYVGAKSVSVAGGEADDLIALFCQQLKCPITVWTVDADLLQLVRKTPRVVVRLSSAHTGEDRLFSDPDSLYKEVPLRFTRLHKSIVGDVSDSYAGVKGIGDAGWAALVEFVGWDGMLELDEIIRTNDKERLQDAVSACHDKGLTKLNDAWGQWQLSYALAGLHPDTCHSVKGNRIVRPEWVARIPNEEKLSQLLYSAGGPDLLDRYKKWLPSEKLVDASNVGELPDMAAEWMRSPAVSWDFESHDTLRHEDFRKAAKSKDFVDVLSQSVTGISVNWGDNLQHTVYVTTNHADSANVGKEWVVWVVETLLALPHPTVVQNASFELSVSQTDLGIPESSLGKIYDTSIMASYVNENDENHLKGMSLAYLGYKQQTYREVVGSRSMNEVPAIEVLSYGCDDSLVTSHLFDLFKLIMELEGSWGFYDTFETEHGVDTVGTFIAGVPIDTALITALQEEDEETIASSSSCIRSLLAAHGNLRPQQEVAESAKTLLAMRWELKGLRYGKGHEEELKQAYQRLWEQAWEDCFYVPYTKSVDPPAFGITPAKLNKVTETLGFPALAFDKTLSGNQISAWLEQYYDEIEPIAGSGRRAAHLKEFVTLVARLSQAASELQKRPSKAGMGSLTHEEVPNLPEYTLLEKLVNEIYTSYGVGKVLSTGDELNFGSSPQMQALLYGKLGLPVRKRSKVLKNSARERYGLLGAPTTGIKAANAAMVYDALEGDWRREVLTEYKKIVACQQNISLFYAPYPLWVHPRDGRIHPQIKNCGTVTRRPSGTSPNVLQVSNKEEAKIRKVYLPWSEEYIHISLDFKQQEVLITACESNDQVLLRVISEGLDVHSMTATGFAHIMAERAGYAGGKMDYEQFVAFAEVAPAVHKAIRLAAKVTLFTAFYGGGALTVSENLTVEKELGEQLFDGLFQTYPGLRTWQNKVIEFAEKHGYVETAYGNRRHLTNDLLLEDTKLRKRQQRQAVNYLIQGTAADILKVVLHEIHRRGLRKIYNIKGLKPVYDEIGAMVPLKVASEYIAEMREIMAITPPGYPLTLSTDVGVGVRWGDVKEITDLSQEYIEAFIAAQRAAVADNFGEPVTCSQTPQRRMGSLEPASILNNAGGE